MGDETDNVVSLAAIKPFLQTKRANWSDKKSRCQHWHVVVRSDEPILECKDCEAIVDPFHYIRNLAGLWDGLMAQKKRLEADIEALQESKKQVRQELRRERDKADREISRQAMVLPPHMTKR